MKKKILSFILIIQMMIPCISATSYAEDKKEVRDNQCIELLTKLSFLSVFSDIPKEDKALTRAEFIAMVMNIADKNLKYREYDDIAFLDVMSNHVMYNYIRGAYEANVVSGSDGKINPDNLITQMEAVKILLSVLGYDSLAAHYGGYPHGYMEALFQTSIADGVKIEKDGELKFSDACLLICNALDEEMREIRFEKGALVETGTECTILETKYDIYKDQGIIKENTYTSTINENTKGIRALVNISGFEGYMYNSFLSEKYFGQYVEYYYQEETNEILYLAPIDKKNEVIELKDSEIDSFSFSDRRLYYTKGEGQRTKSERIPITASVIINGSLKLNYKEEDLCPQYGKIKLIDNNNDSDIDVVIVQKYSTYFVGSVDQNESVITDYYDTGKRLNIDTENSKEKSVLITDTELNFVEAQDITQYDVLTVMEGENGIYYRGILSHDTQNVTINGTFIAGDGRDYVRLDSGEEVRIVGNLLNPTTAGVEARYKNVLVPGTKGTAYFDSNRNLVGFIPKMDMTEYGYFVKAYNNEDDDSIDVKIFTVYGMFETYKVAKSFKVDGKRIESISDLPNKSKVVLYKKNGLGEIVYMDTENKTDGESDNTLRSLMGKDFVDLTRWSGHNTLGGRTMLTTNTLIFVAPENPVGAQENDYIVQNIENYRGTNPIKAYSTNTKSFLPEVIHVNREKAGSAPKLSYTDDYGVVMDIVVKLNADDEVATCVTLAQDGLATAKIKTYEVSNDPVTQANLDTVEIGDVVIFNADYNDKILNLDVIYSSVAKKYVDNKDEVFANTAAYTRFDGSPTVRAGYLFGKENDIIAVTTTKPETDTIPDDLWIAEPRTNNQFSMYIVDTSLKGREKVREATLDEFNDYLNSGEADNVFTLMWQTRYVMLVAYK